MDRSTNSSLLLLSALTEYGRSGEENHLRNIDKFLPTEESFGEIPSDVADMVIARCRAVLSSSTSDENRKLAWETISVVCDPRLNDAAYILLDKLADSSFLLHVSAACRSFPKSECCACIQFMTNFTRMHDNRQTLVFNDVGLMNELLVLVKPSAERKDWITTAMLLCIIGGTLSSSSPMITFYSLDGFTIVMDTLKLLVTTGVKDYRSPGAVSEPLQRAIQEAFRVTGNMQTFVTRRLDTIQLTTDQFGFQDELVRLLTSLYNNAIDIVPIGSRHAKSISYTITTCCNNLMYITLADGKISREAGRAAAQHFLLAPGGLSGTSLLSKGIRELRSARTIDGARTKDILIELDRIGCRFPAVGAAIQEEVGEQLTYCAFPTCQVSNLGGRHSRLRKCSNCESVMYCSRDHQKAHWFEHKSECVRVVAHKTAELAVV